MGIEFLLGEVYINNQRADIRDKFRFWEDYSSGKIKSRIYRYNGIIDIETE